MRIAALSWILFTALLPQITWAAGEPILFIFDASGSMSEPFHGVSKMTAARLMLSEQVGRLPIGTRVGLVAYGNGIAGCESYRLYSPIARSSTGAIPEVVRKLKPSGETPIASTLRQVGKVILAKETNARVVLISDGKESCQGDPAIEAALLRAKGISVFVIGLGVDPLTAAELERIAGSGGGKYFNVQTNTDFVYAIEQSTQTPVAGPGRKGEWDDSDSRIVTAEPRDEKKTENVPEAIAPGKDGLLLKGHRLSRTEEGRTKLEIDYAFRWAPSADYLVSLRVERIFPGGSVPIGVGPETHFRAQNGNGTIVIELDPGQVSGESLFIQGELWDIQQMPVRACQSNILRVK
ncbi:MAG: VWA domain-containing protein [Leptospirales bacterium]|nr:VWA domain-containing protein [Leptospirales bacterium]